MSFFEWWGESFNPGPVGHVEIGDDPRAPLDPTWVALRVVLSVGALVGLAILIFGVYQVPTTGHNLGVTAAVTFSYLGFAWLVRPQADLSNLGWAGGLLDNPFRYSDDINRSMLFLSLVLWPGRLISDSFGAGIRLLLGRG
ncbi:MAG: hypothetical protein R3F62_02175 [Planctomycetota bacterium]